MARYCRVGDSSNILILLFSYFLRALHSRVSPGEDIQKLDCYLPMDILSDSRDGSPQRSSDPQPSVRRVVSKSRAPSSPSQSFSAPSLTSTCHLLESRSLSNPAETPPPSASSSRPTTLNAPPSRSKLTALARYKLLMRIRKAQFQLHRSSRPVPSAPSAQSGDHANSVIPDAVPSIPVPVSTSTTVSILTSTPALLSIPAAPTSKVLKSQVHRLDLSKQPGPSHSPAEPRADTRVDSKGASRRGSRKDPGHGRHEDTKRDRDDEHEEEVEKGKGRKAKKLQKKERRKSNSTRAKERASPSNTRSPAAEGLLDLDAEPPAVADTSKTSLPPTSPKSRHLSSSSTCSSFSHVVDALALSPSADER